MMRHQTVEANGGLFHVATLGEGPPLLLLHGWPEFWRTWDLVMPLLADRFTLVAPDLRGFGDSSKPDRLWGADDHAADMRALLDAMGIGRAGVVGHDVGGAVMLSLARQEAARWSGLFFFDFSYPGIGARMGAPERLTEIWYQSFHQKDFAPALVGATRESATAYFGHFLRHWSHRKEVWTPELVGEWVDNFLKPGNLEGGFNYYKAANANRIAFMKGGAPPLAPIGIPTCVRWASDDAIFPFSFSDKLPELFTDLDLQCFQGVGHYPHREAPDEAAGHIGTFFAGRG